MVGKNNPFNIRYNPRNMWIGLDKDQVYRGFCNFINVKYGIRAACYLLMVSYRRKGVVSISEIISRFAPSSENNTDLYIQFVCNGLGCFPFDYPKSRLDFAKLLHYMSKYEGNPVSVEDILKVINLFNLKIKKS